MKVKVESSEAPRADHILSQAIISNDLIFVAGQIHSTPDGQIVEGTTKEKLAQIMNNIFEILKSANADMDDIVKVVIYVTDMSVMPELNELYPSYFKEPFPAREAVCVKELPLDASIEISVIAACKK